MHVPWPILAHARGGRSLLRSGTLKPVSVLSSVWRWMTLVRERRGGGAADTQTFTDAEDAHEWIADMAEGCWSAIYRLN